MKKSTRFLLAAGIMLLLYLVYLLGNGILINDNLNIIVFPIFWEELNSNLFCTLFNWSWALTTVVWVVWAIKFGFEERENG
ncbi:hypothetical protein CEB3_c01210 [Peptococcaceae bacterium CEB3]|nr:hypothetical protein CEB3_c01210 [Peptococcaceae bacterium CEB3]